MQFEVELTRSSPADTISSKERAAQPQVNSAIYSCEARYLPPQCPLSAYAKSAVCLGMRYAMPDTDLANGATSTMRSIPPLRALLERPKPSSGLAISRFPPNFFNACTFFSTLL